MEKEINWLVDNWDRIDDKFKVNIQPSRYSEKVQDLNIEEHIVILLLNRQKPSVVASYDFDEERIGVTRTGKIVWGFDSGCSCPSPWEDSFPRCYNVAKEWKQFEIKLSDFDVNWEQGCRERIEEIKQTIKS